MKVLLSGYYGYGNIGDEAVLESIIKGLRERDPEIKITVLSPRRYKLFSIFFQLLQTDVFISGGGTLFQNATSNHSFLYYIGLVWLAKLLRKKVMVFAQGFGPLNGRINRRSILNKVDLITLRDKVSMDRIKELGVNRPPIKLTADPTFYLSFVSVKNERPMVGIVIRELPRKEDYQKLAKTLDWLVQTYKYAPLLLLFHPKRDRKAALTLADLMVDRPKIMDQDADPGVMLTTISQLDLLIGMRLHSLMFATMCNVPMLGLSYDPKVEAFMQEIDQPYIKTAEGLNPEALKATLEYIVVRREKIESALEEKRKELFERAALNFELFTKL
jgi:polysaccharide pyruvyl transferase CsaB